MKTPTKYTHKNNTNYYSGKMINIRCGIVLQSRFFLPYSDCPNMS